MTAEQLALIAGAALSLAFSYIPGLAAWYDPLTGAQKRLIMAGLLAVVALVVFGLSCARLEASWLPAVTCDQPGALALVQVFIEALVANQAAYALAGSARKVKLPY